MTIKNDKHRELYKRLKGGLSDVKIISDNFDLLQSDLKLMLGGVDGQKNKYKIEIAVDYDIVHSYAFTKYDYLDSLLYTTSLDKRKEYESNQLVSYCLLRYIKKHLIFLEPYISEMNNELEFIRREQSVVMEIIDKEYLPYQLKELEEKTINDIIDKSNKRGSLSLTEKQKIIETIKTEFPEIYSFLTFERGTGFASIYRLLRINRLVKYNYLFPDLKINRRKLFKNYGEIKSWLMKARPSRSNSNMRDSSALSYISYMNNELNRKAGDGYKGVIVILASHTDVLDEYSKKNNKLKLVFEDHNITLPIVRGKSFWKTFFTYFKGPRKMNYPDKYLLETFKDIDNDKYYLDLFMHYATNYEKYIRDRRGNLIESVLEEIETTIDIVQGIILNINGLKNLRMARTHKWENPKTPLYIDEVDKDIADLAKRFLTIIKTKSVRKEIDLEIQYVGNSIANSTLLINFLWRKLPIGKPNQYGIIRKIIKIKNNDILAIKRRIFEASVSGESKKGALEIAKIRQIKNESVAKPEIFVLTSYLFGKYNKINLGLNEIETGEKYCKRGGYPIDSLVLVKAMLLLKNDNLQEALECCKNFIDSNNSHELELYYGFLLWLKYRKERKKEYIRKAIEYTKRASDSDDYWTKIISLCNLSYAYTEINKFHLAGECKKIIEEMEAEKYIKQLYYNLCGYRIYKQITRKVISEEDRVNKINESIAFFKRASISSKYNQVAHNLEKAIKIKKELTD